MKAAKQGAEKLKEIKAFYLRFMQEKTFGNNNITIYLTGNHNITTRDKSNVWITADKLSAYRTSTSHAVAPRTSSAW